MACVGSFRAAPGGVGAFRTSFFINVINNYLIKSSMLPPFFQSKKTAKAWHGILHAYLYPLQNVQFIFTLATFMFCMQQNGH